MLWEVRDDGKKYLAHDVLFSGKPGEDPTSYHVKCVRELKNPVEEMAKREGLSLDDARDWIKG